MTGSVAVRSSLAVLAVLALAWLGVLLRDHYVGRSAGEGIAAAKSLSTAAHERRIERLKDAELLNPDSSWDIAQGSYWALNERPRRAAEAAFDVLEDEPENIEAWRIVVIAARLAGDERREAEARAKMRQLNPLGSF
jgi:hypothetical protein